MEGGNNMIPYIDPYRDLDLSTVANNPSYDKYRRYIRDDGSFIDHRGANRPYYQEVQKGLADLYYQDIVNKINYDELPIGQPVDYIRDANHAFDEYVRSRGDLMHVGLYGYDNDGTAAEWASSAGSGDDRLANLGRIHYGKFGYSEPNMKNKLYAPGYYDAQGRMVRPAESSALKELFTESSIEPEYQEYEPGLNFLTNDQLADQGVVLNETAKRNMELRAPKLMRKAAPQQRVNDYLAYMRNNKELFDDFTHSVNLTPELMGTDDTDTVRGLMEMYGANAYNQGRGNMNMPDIGLEQVFTHSPDRKTDTYVDNLKRLYRNSSAPSPQVQTLQDRLKTRDNYQAPTQPVINLGLGGRSKYGASTMA